MTLALRIWRCRWALARLLVAGALLWSLAADTGARLARLRLASLPGLDYAAEVASLRAQGRFGEALMVGEAARLDPDADHAVIEREVRRAEQERDAWLSRLGRAGMGALSGTGTSLEGLVGAVAADFFVVGDVRDLVIQGGKLLADGETDELILALSAAGLVTTVAPAVDWVPSVLKAARKAGTMSTRLGDSLLAIVKRDGATRLAPVLDDVASISKRASPGGAMRLLRHADDPAELARLARFVERSPSGAFALHVTGAPGARLIKAFDGASPGARHADALVLAASRKGRAGAAFLGSPAAARLLRPHPLIGIAKAFAKGHADDLVARALERAGGKAWWLIPALGAWVFLELALIASRLAPGAVGRGARASPAPAA